MLHSVEASPHAPTDAHCHVKPDVLPSQYTFYGAARHYLQRAAPGAEPLARHPPLQQCALLYKGLELPGEVESPPRAICAATSTPEFVGTHHHNREFGLCGPTPATCSPAPDPRR
eukprot:scaffold153952_cov32-Tisochrysis_lutea.AAC.3